MINKHGLSRTIHEDIKRRIRQECGFGCVCCGLAITAYEHIDPEFNEAKIHDPEKMTLLCGGCHDRVTRGFWSKDKIKAAKLAPWCIKAGHCHDAFDLGNNNVTLWIGTNRIVNINSILSVDDTILLSIEPPEEKGAPFRLSGIFYDENENFLYKIVRNEWFGESNNWDIECTGGRITIRTNRKNIALQLLCLPPHGILIKKMNMFYKNTHFYADEMWLKITGYDGSFIKMIGRDFRALSCDAIAFSAVSQGSLQPLSENIGALGIGPLRMFGGGECILGSMSMPDNLPKGYKGIYLKKHWGKIYLNPAIKS